MADLKVALPEFDEYGVDRDDGDNKGEFNTIFYSLVLNYLTKKHFSFPKLQKFLVPRDGMQTKRVYVVG